MNYLFVLPKASSKSSGGYNIFPVGITYVTAYLKRTGVNVVTANLEYFDACTEQALKELIGRHHIDLVATAGLSRDYRKVKEVIDVAKQVKPDILTLVGGGIISGDPEPAMKALGADFGVIGEGEKTTADLTAALDDNISYTDIPGLVYRDENGVYTMSSGEPKVIDINEIPIPDYEGFDYSAHIEAVNHSYAYVVASRSCPFQCTFCFHPSGTKYRQRSLDNLFQEIDYLIDNYNVRTIGISDEIFASSKERVLGFCKRIKEYPVTWTVQLRVSDVDDGILSAMADSGCICVSYGIESADNNVLKSMKKKITVEQINEALSLTYKYNMEIQGGLIFGDEAETQQSVEKSLAWYDAHAEYALELNMIHIFPGSELYKNACDNRYIADRIKYLVDGCPLLNVSKLSDKQYKDLSSFLYEKNMKVKNPPKDFYIKEIYGHDDCLIVMKCNKCLNEISVRSNVLHMQKVSCPVCRQRHYVDPYEKVKASTENMEINFKDQRPVAIWGAGEVCIKLIERFEIFRSDSFYIVDISKSRQGYTVCGKNIHSPEVIIDKNIDKVVIAVMARKNEVVAELADKYKNVKTIYLPAIKKTATDIFTSIDVENIDQDRNVD